MTDPSYALQKGIYDTLTAAAIGTDNIFHTVAQGTALPWVIIGDDQILSDYEAGPFSECFATIHVYGAKPDFKEIAMKVRVALDAPLTLDGFTIMEVWFEQTNYITEIDKQIGHAVMTFRYLIQPN